MDRNRYIYKHDQITLNAVSFHKNIDCITRYFASEAPVYIAIHKIDRANSPEAYTQLHSHDEDEINIILSTEEQLRFNYCIGERKFIIGEDSTIFIPKNKPHFANVVSGSGYYITIRLEDKGSL